MILHITVHMGSLRSPIHKLIHFYRESLDEEYSRKIIFFVLYVNPISITRSRGMGDVSPYCIVIFIERGLGDEIPPYRVITLSWKRSMGYIIHYAMVPCIKPALIDIQLWASVGVILMY